MMREQIRAALTDPVALTCTLYGEAAGENLLSQVAVGCVIRNRVLADVGGDGRPDWWGEDFRGVCLAPNQFSCWWGSETDANSKRVYQLAEGLITRQPVGEKNLVAELRWIADGLLTNQIQDHTRAADHYLTRQLLMFKPPAWTKGRTPVAQIGAHVFFRLSQ